MVEVLQYTPADESSPLTVTKKRKRNLPGTPDPDAEVIALSPQTLTATNRYVCEVCGKGFQRDQNLQLHRRGHNLPWTLKLRTSKEAMKRVYVCPEKNCVHHNPTRALGDLTGIKKHFCRKHGEKKWKCERCCKMYAVRSDWRAHSKICGTREYKCHCGTLFSRRDSFVTHRAFCDALAEETARVVHAAANYKSYNPFMGSNQFPPQCSSSLMDGLNPYPTNNTPLVASKLCGFYGAEDISTGVSLESSVEGFVSDVEDSMNNRYSDMNIFYHSQFFPVAERQRTAPSKDSVADCPGGRTLDLLGAGVPSLCQLPYSINGLF